MAVHRFAWKIILSATLGGLLLEHSSATLGIEGPAWVGSGLALVGIVVLYEVVPPQYRRARKPKAH